MTMSFNQFVERIEKSKSYDITELFVSTIPSELYTNNSMSLPVSAELDLYNACMGKFASDKDESDYYKLAELIANNKPIYPLIPVIKPKDVVGLTLNDGETEWTLNIDELRGFAADEIFGVIDTPYIKINSKAASCIKSVFKYVEHGGKVTSIYQQSSGIQVIPAASASYVNIIEGGEAWKVRINGTLTIPMLRVPAKYYKFLSE